MAVVDSVSTMFVDRVVTRTYKATLWFVTIPTLVAFFWVIWHLWGGGRIWWIWPLMTLLSYSIVSPGVTVGLHRFFTHRSFTANKGVTIVLGVLAGLALQGPIIQWVANHRLHHKWSDEVLDLHSPWKNKLARLANMADEPESPMELVLGLIWAHVGWLASDKIANTKHFAPDLLDDPLIVRLSNLFPLLAVLTFLLPTLIGGGIGLLSGYGLVYGLVHGLVWGGLARIAMVQHITWSINSICHVWGSRPFYTGKYDHSGNVSWLRVLSLAESEHNRHHAFPTSAVHGPWDPEVGIKWWDDLSFAIIRFMEWRGWVSHVKTPTARDYAQKKRQLVAS